VLFHGGPGLEHRVLLPLAEQLAEAFEVWVPDLPGHGDAPRLDPGASVIQKAMVRLATLDGGADLVVGHSLGAWLLRDCLRQGTLTPRQGVVLLSPPSGGQPRIRGMRIRRQTRGSLVADLLEQVRSETGRPPSPRFVECLEQSVLHGVDAYPNLHRTVAKALSRPLTRLRPTVPVTVISGECDRVVSLHQASEVAAATSATLVTLPGVGHYPAATGDDGVARAIADIIR
jgi:pimeloyl-ACP methyl ester carboxylesterase